MYVCVLCTCVGCVSVWVVFVCELCTCVSCVHVCVVYMCVVYVCVLCTCVSCVRLCVVYFVRMCNGCFEAAKKFQCESLPGIVLNALCRSKNTQVAFCDPLSLLRNLGAILLPISDFTNTQPHPWIFDI